MKRRTISILAIAAFGTVWQSAQTAEASAQWWGSTWQSGGTVSDYTISVTGNAPNNMITASYWVGPAACDSQGLHCVYPPGTSHSLNRTGAEGGYPTCAIATEECADGSYINGPGFCSYSAPCGSSCDSDTRDLGPNSQGYYGYYSGGMDSGYCPANYPYIAGGVWLYEFL